MQARGEGFYTIGSSGHEGNATLAEALRERTDSCTVPAAGVVGEAMLAIVLASAYREKFGGDHVDDVRAEFGDDIAKLVEKFR